MTNGPLIASGRDADIFDAGPGRVMRRSRSARSQATEAAVMRHVGAHGYPAPEVIEVSGDGIEMVMQRVDGPTMLADLTKRPWRLSRHARTLAGLITRLATVPPMDGLPPGPVPGDRVVHLDLHPDNVILGENGPVVIDWTNARSGDPASDLALTWLLISCADIPGSGIKHALEESIRGRFLKSFLRSVDVDAARAALPAIVAWKANDQNTGAAEVANMRAMLD